MNRILQMWNHVGTGFDRPSIAPAVRAFLEGGLVEAIEERTYILDTMMTGPGQGEVYRCRNGRGETLRIHCWGNTDGWGMIEVAS